MTILVTGAAGFISFHVVQGLIDKGEQVIDNDNLNDYYDVSLKEEHLARLHDPFLFTFHREDIADQEAINRILVNNQDISCIIHLAA